MRHISGISVFYLLLSQSLPFTLAGQVQWFNPGEVFYYDVRTGLDAENYGIHSMTYAKDTVINGYMLKTLKYIDKKGGITDIFIQQEGEKVRNYTPVLNQFKLMYDFTALPGDPSPVSGFTIETTGTIEIENTTRKTQIWRQDSKRVLVIEGIGMVGDPNFTSLYVCSPPVPSLGCTGAWDGYDFYFRCMLSSNLHFNPYGFCATSSTNDEVVFATIYPNPTINSFTLKSSRIFDEYRMYDQTGTLVYQEKMKPKLEATCHFDIKPSLYIIQMYHEKKLICTEKLVVLPAP